MSATVNDGLPRNPYYDALANAHETFPKGVHRYNTQHAIEAHLRLLRKTEKRSRCPEVKQHAREAAALLTGMLEDIRPAQPVQKSWTARWGLGWLGLNS